MNEEDEYKIITMVQPNMSEKEIEKGFKIQKAILKGECNKCKYLKKCENGINIENADAWCNK